jgi:prevent-host-death family protein
MIVAMNALEAKNQFGHLLDTAQAHPVQINKHGHPVAYVVSATAYERLTKPKDLALEQAVLKANMEETQDADYQEELSSWDGVLNDGLKD